jgi:FlaA1/EpsC-like NDP-sugar epimerase
MNRILITKNLYYILLLDIAAIIFSYYSANLLRFDFSIPPQDLHAFYKSLPIIIVIKLFCLFLFNLYRGMWRYTSISDLMNIIKACVLSTLLVVVVILYSPYRFVGFARSVFLIDLAFSFILIAGIRVGIRLFYQKQQSHNTLADVSILPETHPHHVEQRPVRKNLLIIGAGDCGEKIFRELRDNPHLNYKISGFLDDNASKIGKTIHGIPVLSIISDLKTVVERMKVDEILIAIPSATNQEMRRVVSLCKDCGVKFRTVPGYGELINGRVTVNSIREVVYRDLIRRETVKLDEKMIESYICGHRVLVTGGGGSIGSELCRQIASYNPQQLVIFERAESPLYEIELELRKKFSFINVIPVLGDIQDREHLKGCFEKYRPRTVLHAAAYKHVPMLETQPWKAIENNVRGTANLVGISNEFEVEHFLMVSTDKAVRPANVMGASKRVAEMITLNHNSCAVSKTRFMAVRFGNVIGSAGSVVPLFKRQIEEGGPVTVTHPDVTRFFMTIREAAQLILQAGAMGQGGEIFILDMGTPVKIVDMARDLISLSGFVPDEDIRIEFIGLRPGEKLYEELITSNENAQPTLHPKILMLKGSACDLELLNGKIQELSALAMTQDAARIRSKLQEIVPDYAPSDTSMAYKHMA